MKLNPNTPVPVNQELGALVDDMILALRRCSGLAAQCSSDSSLELLKMANLDENNTFQRDVIFEQYRDETQIEEIMSLITRELSEPYSVYTYRYFISNWPELCILAKDTCTNKSIGVIISKRDDTARGSRGYIAMLAVDTAYRRMGIGTRLVQAAIDQMKKWRCIEVSLETEVTNKNSTNLYSRLGFIREKRLFRYYLNGVDAFRLKLSLQPTSEQCNDAEAAEFIRKIEVV